MGCRSPNILLYSQLPYLRKQVSTLGVTLNMQTEGPHALPGYAWLSQLITEAPDFDVFEHVIVSDEVTEEILWESEDANVDAIPVMFLVTRKKKLSINWCFFKNRYESISMIDFFLYALQKHP